jgi:uncharacterized protein YprB with RNaseH-like and TPR domain
MESISEKLRSLGVKKGTSNLIKVDRNIKRKIHEVITGGYIESQMGSVFVHTEKYPSDYMHGLINLSNEYHDHFISKWAKTQTLDKNSSNQLVFLDTETTSLSSGTGTFVFLTGLGFQTTEGFQVKQFFLDSPANEMAFLLAIEKEISNYRGVITFNGKSFDIPMLNNRFTLNSEPSPFSSLPHIDLLPLARRLWKYRLPRRNLGTLEFEIIGSERSQDEIPGWMVPEIYVDYLRTEDPTPLLGVFYHNAQDILSLSALYFHLSDLLENCDIKDIDQGLDLMALGHLFRDLGDYEKAILLYEGSLKNGIPQDFYLSTINEYARIQKRKGNIKLAVEYWGKAERLDDLQAIEELAKYYEHNLVDNATARRYAARALDTIPQLHIPKSKKRSWQNLFTKRLARLDRKLDIKNT